jgi:hypothetical protein
VLECRVLRREDRVQPRGGREASGVLEKGRVEERGALGTGQPELGRQPQSEQARPPGVPHRLAFNEVERAGKGSDDLGEPEVACLLER